MDKTAFDDTLEWKKLPCKSDSNKASFFGVIKGFISGDHLIILSDSFVYTFHLKELSWLSFLIKKSARKASMTSCSCLVKPGLILELISSYTLQLLSYETDERGPKDFKQEEKTLDSYNLPYGSHSSINSDHKTIYIFGGKIDSKESNALYRLDIGSWICSELRIGGTKPCERMRHLSALHEGKLFIYGGVDKNNTPLSDFWTFDLRRMVWTQLALSTQDRLRPILRNPLYLQAIDDDRILLYDHEDCDCSLFNYSLKKNSWEPLQLSSKIPREDNTLLAKYQDSFILFSKFEVYSLNIPSKKQACKKSQLENFATQLFNEKEAYPDVMFKVGDEEIPANKCILSVRCSYFKNAFSSKMMESQNKIIPIKDVRAKVFKAMLQYIYFADIDLDQDMAEDLFKLSHEYGLEELKSYCEEVLVKDIQVENVVKYIKFAEQYDANELRKACLVFVSENPDKVFKSQNIKELDNETLLELYKMK